MALIYSFSELPIEFAVEEARPAAKVNPAIDDGQDDLVMQQEIFDVCISVVPGLSGDGDRRDFLPCEGRKWGKIRPAGTISREGMRIAASREIVPVGSRRAEPSSLPEKHAKAIGEDARKLPCKGREWRKIRPAGTISREGMRTLK